MTARSFAKHFIVTVFALLSTALWQQAAAQVNGAPNIGFENGTFDNWESYVGSIDTLGNITVYAGSVPRAFRIIKSDRTREYDEFGGFPIINPNGSQYSVLLGNTDKGNYAQRLAYTLTVPPTGLSSIVFDYAVVFNNGGGHISYQQPRFTLRVFDVTDNKYLDCPSFDFICQGGLPGFKISDNNPDVFSKDWSAATIDLKGFNNKTVRLEFTVNHCPFVEHFGYVYLDVQENNGSAIAGNAFCNGARSVTLTAPAGFDTYTWYNGDVSKTLGKGERLTIFPAPPDLTKFAVRVTPYNGLGCIDTLYTQVNKINSEFNLQVRENVQGCPGNAVDLTKPYITQGSSTGMMLSYFKDSLATEKLYSPNLVTQEGTYYIKGLNAEGCSNILPVNVSFIDPSITVTDPAPVSYPEKVDLSKTFVPQTGVNYAYYTDAAATIPLTGYDNVARSGIYYIKGETEAGCTVVAPIHVIVNAAAFSVKAPNTFTPNRDGVNDTFMVTLKGYVTFANLKIYNRNGQLIYQTLSEEKPWTGTFNGSDLPAGTYYWVFEGTDDAYHKKISEGASITLIR